VIGGLYAGSQGASQTTADAIYDQYTPASMDDGVPRSLEGAILGIADRADTIAGMFGLGMEPTGSKDPFALRRAANGIVKILAETSLPLTLLPMIKLSAKDEETGQKMSVFFRERVEFYLREVRGQAYDVVAAVLFAGADDVRDVAARAEAVTAVRDSEDFAAVSAAFKRMKNILAQASSAGSTIGGSGASDVHPAQVALRTAATSVSADFANLAASKDYVAALEVIATLRPQVDTFFEQVMVMDPDLKVRAARLGLLSEIVRTFSAVGDFSEIVTAG